jgi:hypothetical protein
MRAQTPAVPVIEEAWPPYGSGSPKHVHAIGVIALTYATLQGAIDRLFLNKAQSEWAEKFYYGLSEDKRSDEIKNIFKNDDPSVFVAIANVVKYLDWCRACRNMLLHAESYPPGLSSFPRLRFRADLAIEEKVRVWLHGVDVAGNARRCRSHASGFEQAAEIDLLFAIGGSRKGCPRNTGSSRGPCL